MSVFGFMFNAREVLGFDNPVDALPSSHLCFSAQLPLLFMLQARM